MGASLRVVLAEDSVLLREGVANLLRERGFDVVGQAGDGSELLQLVEKEQPEVAVVDIRMPPTGTDEGIQAAARLAEEHPGVGVLVLSDHLEPEYATRLLEAGTPGRGYLLKDTITDIDAFAGAIRRVAAGESVVDPAIVRRVFSRMREHDPVDGLSAREREILGLMAEGRSNKAIAEQLVLSERTVETYIGSLFVKLDLAATADDHRRVLAVLAFLRR
jgi:DNA-binding NarL/FixJ family response regulator